MTRTSPDILGKDPLQVRPKSPGVFHLGMEVLGPAPTVQKPVRTDLDGLAKILGRPLPVSTDALGDREIVYSPGKMDHSSAPVGVALSLWVYVPL